MFWIRSFVLNNLVSAVRFATLALAVYILVALIALGLSFDPELAQTTSAKAIIGTVQTVQGPVEGVLKEFVPTRSDDLDLAPYIVLGALIAVLVVLLLYRNRLEWMLVHLHHERHEEAQEALRRQQAEEERVRLEKEAALQREREAQYRLDLQKVQQAAELAAAKAREEARLQTERATAQQVMLEAQRKVAEQEALRRIEAEAIRDAEAGARTRMQESPAPVKDAGGHTREELLEMMAQAKKQLDQQKKNLSFLAIDVVGSTKMKEGEEPALAQRDFIQYRKLVEKAIADNKGLKAAWTPDGVMICFRTVQNAVQAAQQVLNDLAHFNAHVKTLKADFVVRCGINAGSVLFDDAVPIEEITDRTIDIAGHMQKYAKPNTIYIGRHAIEGIRTASGFRPANTQVDGCEVYVWSPGARS
ncbi:MAG: hypothetical protein WC728_13935 [Elusimicrobiota bacterium]